MLNLLKMRIDHARGSIPARKAFDVSHKLFVTNLWPCSIPGRVFFCDQPHKLGCFQWCNIHLQASVFPRLLYAEEKTQSVIGIYIDLFVCFCYCVVETEAHVQSIKLL